MTKRLLLGCVIFASMLSTFFSPALGMSLYIQQENCSYFYINKSLVYDENDSDGNVSYVISITNSGEIRLRNVTLVDIFPNGTKYLGSRYIGSNDLLMIKYMENNTNGTAKKISWDLGDLQTGEEKQIEIMVQMAPSIPADQIYANKAMAEGAALGRTIYAEINGTFRDIEKEKYRSIQVGPRIDIISAFISTETENRWEYTLLAMNTGDEKLTNVILNAELPRGMRLISADPEPQYVIEDEERNTTLIWTFDELPVGVSQGVFLTVNINGNISKSYLESCSIWAVAKYLRKTISSEVKGSIEAQEAT